jgi:VWFA-related protein
MRALILILTILLLSFVQSAHSQETGQDQAAPQEDEVIRITTSLVQLDVMVFDKQGKFVNDLRPEQFELRLDGRPQTISFFERVTSGSMREEAQLSAMRDPKARSASADADSTDTVRGRAVFFFIDDLHLSSDSVTRTRKLLQRFVDDEMGADDEAVIVSTSGQLGFLQQLTDNKAVLRAAIMQLGYRARSNTVDLERPPINEFQALAIAHNDQDAITYFTDQTLKEYPGMMRDAAEEMVTARAHQILEHTATTTMSTLSTLQSLVRSSAQLPGRKLVFFISDGFFLDTNKPNLTQKIEDITDAAARSGVVIYTMDARGLTTGMPDASSSAPADPSGRLAKINGAELSASQEVLRTLAADTGGRALLNTNALDKALTKTLNETSAYYLIAWKPDRQVDSANKFQHVEISIKGHPELTIKSRRGFYAATREAAAPKPVKPKNKAAAASPQEVELRAALGSLYPRTALPTYLSLGYINTANDGTTLTALIQIDAGDYAAADEPPTANTVDALNVVFDSKGKSISSIQSSISFAPKTTAQEQSPTRRALFSRQFKVTPGLYQVRIAARDNKSGRMGSSAQWIEIPNVAGGEFALGSLMAAEHIPAKSSAQGGAPTPETVSANADHNFERTSKLRFLTFIYNAAPPTDVVLSVIVLRNRQPIITVPLKRVEMKGIADLTRIPYAADVDLSDLVAGRYVLQVTVIDRTTRKSATQELKFTVR